MAAPISRISKRSRLDPRWLICRHIHLPVQNGSTAILKAMNRRYTREQYLELVQKIKSKIPEISLTTDIMMGFPGETEEYFENTRRFIEGLPFGLLHVFPYSPRPGTPAADFKEKVPHSIAANRATQLISLGEAKAQAFALSQMGKQLEILVEHDGTGWTDNYLHATLTHPFPPNTLVTAKIIQINAKREVLAKTGL